MNKVYKKQKDLVEGDLIRVEYGNYDNWVNVVVRSVDIDAGQYLNCCLTVYYEGHEDEPFKMYGSSESLVEVIEGK